MRLPLLPGNAIRGLTIRGQVYSGDFGDWFYWAQQYFLKIVIAELMRVSNCV
jgi:hypothetical protein